MTKITIEIDTDNPRSLRDAQNIINTLSGKISLDTIEYGDPEPDIDSCWVDTEGDTWSNDGHGWRYPETYYGRDWDRIGEKYFPMERKR